MYSGMGDLSYIDFVGMYLNKINPATGMYWLLADVSAATGVPIDTLNIMLNQAQQVNYQAVAAQVLIDPLVLPIPLTDQDIIAAGPPSVQEAVNAPPQDLTKLAAQPPSQIAPSVSFDGLTYYNQDGYGFREGVDSVSFWEESNGTWSMGKLDGTVTLNVQWPPFFDAVDIQRAVNKIIAIKGSEGPGGLPPATPFDTSMLFGVGLIGAGLMTGNLILAAIGAGTLAFGEK